MPNARAVLLPFVEFEAPFSMFRSADAVWVGAVYLETGGLRKVEMTRGVSLRTRRPVLFKQGLPLL